MLSPCQRPNRRYMTGEAEPPSVEAHTTGSVPDPALQAVPVTDLEAGEHEAGMIARVSDKEEARKVEPMNLKLETLTPTRQKAFAATPFLSPTRKRSPAGPTIFILLAEEWPGTKWMIGIEAKCQLLEESSSTD
jgi:hypothetical protein